MLTYINYILLYQLIVQISRSMNLWSKPVEFEFFLGGGLFFFWDFLGGTQKSAFVYKHEDYMCIISLK